MKREIEITPADVLRLRALGVRAEPEQQTPQPLASRDDIIIAALNDRIADLTRSERRAWSEARRWRLWGWICAIVATVSLLSQIIIVVAQRGGW